MKKRLVLLVLLSILMVTILTACGGGGEGTNKSPSGGFFENVKYIDDQTLSRWSTFQEERAWVQFGAFETTTALIDKEGKILWESDARVTETSEIRDGFAYCKLDGEELDTYVLLDSDGNVTCTKECDENFIILGQGKGLFLAAEHVLSFDTNEWRIGAIDKDGNTVVPFKAYETSVPLGVDPTAYAPRTIGFDEEHSYRCSYVGDGVFELFFIHKEYNFWMVQVLLNIETQSVIFTYDTYNNYSQFDVDVLSNFENGSAIVLLRRGNHESWICTSSLDGEMLYDVNQDNELIHRYGQTFSDGLLRDGKKYYSIDGECVIDFPQYRGKYEYSCENFVNGYAHMNIVGADGNDYFTVIDKNGSFMFEPVSGFGRAIWNNDHCLISCAEDCLAIFDINGNLLYSIECQCIDYPGTYAHRYIPLLINMDTKSVVSVGENIIGIGDFYLDLETGTTIGEHRHDVIITAY